LPGAGCRITGCWIAGSGLDLIGKEVSKWIAASTWFNKNVALEVE